MIDKLPTKKYNPTKAELALLAENLGKLMSGLERVEIACDSIENTLTIKLPSIKLDFAKK